MFLKCGETQIKLKNLLLHFPNMRLALEPHFVQLDFVILQFEHDLSHNSHLFEFKNLLGLHVRQSVSSVPLHFMQLS